MDIVAYAGIFFTCRYGMTNRKYCMALLYVLVILGVGETAFGYYLSNHLDWSPFGQAERLQLYYAPRWLGTYGCPNHYAALLVMAIGAALALGSFSKLAWPVRIILFYASIMMIVGVIYSGSRGGWIALLAAIGALVTMGIRQRNRAVVSAGHGSGGVDRHLRTLLFSRLAGRSGEMGGCRKPGFWRQAGDQSAVFNSPGTPSGIAHDRSVVWHRTGNICFQPIRVIRRALLPSRRS